MTDAPSPSCAACDIDDDPWIMGGVSQWHDAHHALIASLRVDAEETEMEYARQTLRLVEERDLAREALREVIVQLEGIYENVRKALAEGE